MHETRGGPVNMFCSTDKYLLCADGKVVYLGCPILIPYLYLLQVRLSQAHL